MTEVRCIGCNNKLHTDISGGWCYTCPCGAQVFEMDGELSYPVSLAAYLGSKKYGIAMGEAYRKDVPHIEYYVGYSDYTDKAKEDFIQSLKMVGSISEEECDTKECVQQRKQFRKELIEIIKEGNKWNMSELALAQRFRTPLKIVREIQNGNV